MRSFIEWLINWVLRTARKDPDITLAEYNELVQEATKLRKQMRESDEKRI